jgi:hypothetical protein
VDHAPRASLRMRRYRSVARKSSGLPSPPALAPELMLNANSASSRSDGWPPGCTSVGCGHSALVGEKNSRTASANNMQPDEMRCRSALWVQCHDGEPPALHIHAVSGSPQTQDRAEHTKTQDHRLSNRHRLAADTVPLTNLPLTAAPGCSALPSAAAPRRAPCS